MGWSFRLIHQASLCPHVGPSSYTASAVLRSFVQASTPVLRVWFWRYKTQPTAWAHVRFRSYPVRAHPFQLVSTKEPSSLESSSHPQASRLFLGPANWVIDRNSIDGSPNKLPSLDPSSHDSIAQGTSLLALKILEPLELTHASLCGNSRLWA